MINYSITARAVNNNLFEINQAKARIAQAKAEGKTPDTKDEALVESVVTNYFATAQYTEVMSIEKFARHIADHGATYSRADIMAILYMAVDCMREQLLEGKLLDAHHLGVLCRGEVVGDDGLDECHVLGVGLLALGFGLVDTRLGLVDLEEIRVDGSCRDAVVDHCV